MATCRRKVEVASLLVLLVTISMTTALLHHHSTSTLKRSFRSIRMSSSSFESPSQSRIEAIESILSHYIYGDKFDSDQRKTFAFSSQDKYLATTLSQEKEAFEGQQKRLLTYGEFPLSSLVQILQRIQPNENDVFVDLGSGSGRLVLGVAMLYPCLKYCAGIEILPDLHSMACQAYQTARKIKAVKKKGGIGPCYFAQGNVEKDKIMFSLMTDNEDSSQTEEDGLIERQQRQQQPSQPQITLLQEATIFFAYSTTWRSTNGFHLAPPLAHALKAQLRTDAVVITTDKRFTETDFVLLAELSVPNPEVGGESIAYVARVRNAYDEQVVIDGEEGKDER